jgi:hypothetical protein
MSFWESISNAFDLKLEDRMMAPSSIGLFLKGNPQTFFYLFQQYQPKASILNPFTIYWIWNHIVPKYYPAQLTKIFTPVLSWGSYLMAFYHHRTLQHYVGVDVLDSVCQKCQFLHQYYQSPKKVDIFNCPSEDLLKTKSFLSQYKHYFEMAIFCPPYYQMELYPDQNGQQSTTRYPSYQEWLSGYFLSTIQLCYQVIQPNGLLLLIMNDYYSLNQEYYPLVHDFNYTLFPYFEPLNFYYLTNRTSPLRMNRKSRTEQLFIYRRRPTVLPPHS